MKKIIFGLLVAMVLFASCGNGKLKAGVYEASEKLPDSTVTAKVTIDNEGKITDVYFDETYKDSTKTLPLAQQSINSKETLSLVSVGNSDTSVVIIKATR